MQPLIYNYLTVLNTDKHGTSNVCHLLTPGHGVCGFVEKQQWWGMEKDVQQAGLIEATFSPMQIVDIVVD